MSGELAYMVQTALDVGVVPASAPAAVTWCERGDTAQHADTQPPADRLDGEPAPALVSASTTWCPMKPSSAGDQDAHGQGSWNIPGRRSTALIDP